MWNILFLLCQIDTLKPDLQPQFNMLRESMRLSYKATKLTPPPAGCNILQIFVGAASWDTLPSTKECSVFIWKDNGGPDSVIVSGKIELHTYEQWKVEFKSNFFDITQRIKMREPFWVGSKEWDTLYPTLVVDHTQSVPSQIKRISAGSWSAASKDWYHKVLVDRDTTPKPYIYVSPNPIIFHIDSATFFRKKARKKFPSTIYMPRWDDEAYWKDIVPNEVIVGYKNTIQASKASNKELGIGNFNIIKRGHPALNYIVVEVPGTLEDTKYFMKEMLKKPNVKYVEPNRYIHYFFTPNDPRWTNQWGPKSIRADSAWDITLGTMDIKVGISDQGVDYRHEDLIDRFTPGNVGYDLVDNDNDPMPASANESHGTAVAGIIGATINNAVGIAGIANCHLYSARAGATAAITHGAESIQWCVDNGMHIISMSWGGGFPVGPIQTAVQNAWNAGCLLVAASGNSGTGTVSYPAAYPEVIAVGALDINDQLTSYSQYGPEQELTAPAGEGNQLIETTIPFTNAYTSRFSGTSAACPHVSGVAALVWSLDTSLTNQDIRDILDSTAIDLGPPGRDDEYGFGKVNAYGAVMAVVGREPTDRDRFMIQNKPYAGANLVIDSMKWNKEWIKFVDPTTLTLPPGNSQNVNIGVAGKLSTGTYYDTIRIYSNDKYKNPYLLEVILRVGKVGVEEKYATIQRFDKFDLFPNPIKDVGYIKYTVHRPTRISIKIYDLCGRESKSIIDEYQPQGEYEIKVDIKNLSSGIYFISFSANSQRKTNKFIVLH